MSPHTPSLEAAVSVPGNPDRFTALVGCGWAENALGFVPDGRVELVCRIEADQNAASLATLKGKG